MIRFVCECGKQLQASEESAGRIVLCPACKQQATVPDLPSSAIQAAEEQFEPEPAVRKRRPVVREESDEDDRADRAAPEKASTKAVVSLVLGILSLFCNVLAGLPALIVGILAMRDIGRSRERLGGRGLAIAGIVSACIGTMMSCGLISLTALPALLIPSVQKVRDAAARAQSTNNLKQMALAMMSYEAANGTLPPGGIVDPLKPQGEQKPLLSWRVAILPYIGQQNLYSQFKLNEPWDSPNNLRLLSQMPNVYNCPATQTKSGETVYQVFVGKGAAFDKTRGHRIQTFVDGASNTILIVEAAKAVPWTKPDDVPFDPSKPILPLMSTSFRGGFNVVMVDGSVRFVPQSVSEMTLKAAITPDASDVLGADW